MNRLSTLFGTAFGLVLLVAILAGGYFLLEYIGGVFTSLEPQTRTLAAISSVVVLLAAAIIAEGLKARGIRDPQAVAQRVATYERLLSLCCEQRHRAEAADALTERALALQGSAKVISAYVSLRRAKLDNAPNEAQTALLESLIAEMRRDCGRQDLIRKKSDLLELLTQPAGDVEAAHRAGARMVHE